MEDHRREGSVTPPQPDATPSESPGPAPEAGGSAPAPPLGVLELMYGALFSPVSTFRQVVARPHLGRAVLVLVVVAVVGATVGAITGSREAGAGLAQAGIPVSGVSFGPLAFLFGLVGPFLFWYLQTAVFYLTGVLLGGRGEVVPLLAALAVAGMPQVFSAPAALLSAAVHQGLGIWLSLAIGIWTIVLDVLAVREGLHFSTGRAIATLCLPLAVLVVLIVAGAIAFVVAFLPLFEQFVPGTMPPLP